MLVEGSLVSATYERESGKGKKAKPDRYLPALYELRDDSEEYRSALYDAIYRAELAKTRGR